MGNRLTKHALSTHLKILKIASDCDSKELSSVNNLLSQYKHLKSQIRKIWVCGHSKCESVLSTQKEEKHKTEKPIRKQPCGHNYIEDERKDNYILHLPIEKQLVYFIENHGLDQNENSKPVDFNYRSDINSGTVYTEKKKNNLISDNTITLQLNMDGATCFKVTTVLYYSLRNINNFFKHK